MPVTTRDIRDKVFRNSGRGYNKDDVDSFLDEIIDEMNLLCNKIDALEMRAEAEQAKAKSISSASLTAEQMISEAKAHAQQIIRDAKDLAEDMLDDARKKSEELLQNSHKEESDFGASELWHGYPGFDDDLKAISKEQRNPAQIDSRMAKGKESGNFSFDDLDFEKDLSSSKENIREALLSDMGLENDRISGAPEIAQADLTKKKEETSTKPVGPYANQDDYYNLLYGPGPATKLDITEVARNETPVIPVPNENPVAKQQMVYDQAGHQRLSTKYEPVPFPGSRQDQEHRQQTRPNTPTMQNKSEMGSDVVENSYRAGRNPQKAFQDTDELFTAKQGKGNSQDALMPLEIDERKPLQRYSTVLDGFARLNEGGNPGAVSDRLRRNK